MIDTKLNLVPTAIRAQHRPAGRWARLWRVWRSHARRRATLSALSDLDDRMLQDIGIRRADLALLQRYSKRTRPLSGSRLFEALRERRE